MTNTSDSNELERETKRAKTENYNNQLNGNTLDINSNLTHNNNNNNNINKTSSVGNDEQVKSLVNSLDNINHNSINYMANMGESVMLWDPKNTKINQNTKLVEFQKLIETKFNVKFENYDDLYKWSIKNHFQFWEEFWNFSEIVYSKNYDRVLDKDNVSVDNIPFKWFDGALLNYAENLLKHDDDKIAVYSFGEAFEKVISVTFKEMREAVRKIQIGLKNLGVKKGDFVVGYLPNSIECLQAKLAVNSLGAVWSCASPDFGSLSVIERFKQISPKVIFSITSVNYNGKKHEHKSKLTEVVNGIKSIEKVIIVPFNNNQSEEISDIPNSVKLEDFLKCVENNTESLKFEQVPFNHPLVILYSSGTTGSPKCIVHSHGGTLIQHLKEHLLQGNVCRDDVIFFYTTTGWMMYNWLISSLAIGCSIVLYDGSPLLPNINVLWDLVDQLKITMFGTSPKWLSVIQDKKCIPKENYSLESLKIIYTTGSPLKPANFDYVYNSIKSDIILGSITGGSDIISLFCGHNINLPVYKGEIQCRHLGMAVECWNEDGKSVYNECGELVCTKPFPSMPVYFHNDENFKKYKSSYFEKYPGVWAHGDFCMINEKTGGVVMLGRSDGTLNPNGVRFGSADLYNITESMEEVEDSLCVGQRNPNEPEEERVILFLKVKENYVFNKDLVAKVKTNIRSSLSPRHVPSIILPISEIPYTLNGKKVEVPVRRILEGIKITPSSSLVNPKSLEQFKNIEELNKW